MHGSVCLFSKYLQHLLEGENLDELDISSASASNNVFRDKKSLSTGWVGTCPILESLSTVQNSFNQEVSSLKTIISSSHPNTISAYEEVTNSINNLYIINSMTAARPSGLTDKLIPVFENEFKDKTNEKTIGGAIYKDYTTKLTPFYNELNNNVLKEMNTIASSNSLKDMVDTAYSNFQNFDNTVATASNMMNTRILDLKNYFLTLQFLLMFFTWGFLLFFVILVVIHIIYIVKEYDILYYVIIVLINILFVIMLVEIFLSSFFGQVRLICHEVPRAMNFVFTGSYIVSGNSASYPASFGRGEKNMTMMFKTCLNDNIDLLSLFISSDYVNTLISAQNRVENLYNNISDVITKSNIMTNDYDSIQNTFILKGIMKLELMHDNLFLASEGFGEDEVTNILSKIRQNLDSVNCSLKEENYVVRESDCPSGSTILNKITYIQGEVHCYVIQKLVSETSASYSPTGCDNNYINKAIRFITELNLLLENRIVGLKTFLDIYSAAYKSISDEVTSLSDILKTSHSVINKNLYTAKNISNCGSSRFDLIDFSDFIGKTTEYDARLVVIFAAFMGVFGFVMLFSFLVVINGVNVKDNDDEDYGYGNFRNKNIKIKVNKPIPKKINSNYYDKDDDNIGEDNLENNNSNYKNDVKNQSKTGQKVEMSFLKKNSEDYDSS